MKTLATTQHTTPASASNVLIHGKMESSADNVLIHGRLSASKEKVSFPITTYDNILFAPKVLTDIGENIGAPFHFIETDTVECTDDYIIGLCGHIL